VVVAGLSSCFRKDLFVPSLAATDKEGVIEELVDTLETSGLIGSRDVILNTVLEREKTWTTAIGSGVAVPHGRSLVVRDLAVVFGHSKAGVDFDAPDGDPVHLFFLIVAPYKDKGNRYLPVLGGLVELVSDDAIRKRLGEVSTFEELVEILEGA